MKDFDIDVYPKGEKSKKIKIKKPRLDFSKIFVYFFLLALAAMCIFPFYFMIIYSTHSSADIASRFLLLPGSELISNFQRMITSVSIGRGFLNSLIISVSSTVLTLYLGSLTAYGFAKYKFKGNKFLFAFLLATMMVPEQLSLIGSYRWFGILHLLDNHLAIILPAAAHAFSVFLIKQFIETSLPDEVIESARIDGAGELKIFNRIVLPMLVPILAALGIFAFIRSWNNFMGPLVLLFSEDKFPLPVIVAMIQGYYSTDYGLLYLGVALSVIPIIIAFSFFSKKIMGSVSAGSIKG